MKPETLVAILFSAVIALAMYNLTVASRALARQAIRRDSRDGGR